MAKDETSRILALLTRKGAASSTDFARHLRISRQAAHRRLATLAESGSVVREGAGRTSRWVLPTTLDAEFSYATAGLAEDVVWTQLSEKLEILRAFPKDARSVAIYAFTEMLNNAIEHSGSPRVRVRIRQDGDLTWFTIEDDGVGAFGNVQSNRGLASPLEALEELSKGKVTTMPVRHSGEGIFFTSKVVDRFELDANGVLWIVDNRIADFTVRAGEVREGTSVSFAIGRLPLRPLEDVFAQYTDDFAFTKTRTIVRLFGLGVDFVSRSEAKRLTRNLEVFREVIVDFDRVASIGQAFADELFRVFAEAHPGTRLTAVNMVPAVEFMVRRAVR